MRRQLPRRNIRHWRAFDEVLRLLCEQASLGPHGGASQRRTGDQPLSSFHHQSLSIFAAPVGAANGHQAA
jgi:hypothetical protein